MSNESDEEYVDAVATNIVVAATEITTNADSDSSDEVDMMEVLSLFRFEIVL
jgi:hypothetical protein